MIAPLTLGEGPGAGHQWGNRAVGQDSTSPGSPGLDRANAESKELRRVALQFEEIMVRTLLKPLEKSLAKGMGGEKSSPMVGGMIVSSLSDSIARGGGLGLANVIEQALRGHGSAQREPGESK